MTTNDMAPEERFKLWNKYEDVAMHFNELLIRLRTQALGGIATIVTAASFLVRGSNNSEPWPAVAAVSLLLFFAWCTLWRIDVCYYSRLLHGAVNALRRIENESGDTIWLSTKIEEMFGPRSEHKLSWHGFVFYVPVAAFLAGVFIVSICEARR